MQADGGMRANMPSLYSSRYRAKMLILYYVWDLNYNDLDEFLFAMFRLLLIRKDIKLLNSFRQCFALLGGAHFTMLRMLLKIPSNFNCYRYEARKSWTSVKPNGYETVLQNFNWYRSGVTPSIALKGKISQHVPRPVEVLFVSRLKWPLSAISFHEVNI